MYNTHGVYICLGLLDACICHYVCLLPMCIYTGCVYNETLYTHQQFFSDGPCIEWYAVAYTLSCIMLLLAIGSAVVVYSSMCFNGTPICEDVCPRGTVHCLAVFL